MSKIIHATSVTSYKRQNFVFDKVSLKKRQYDFIKQIRDTYLLHRSNLLSKNFQTTACNPEENSFNILHNPESVFALGLWGSCSYLFRRNLVCSGSATYPEILLDY